MTESELVTNELIVEAIDKIVEKFQKKAIKEREKAKRAYVTYKGEKFFTEDDLMGAYSGDVFSGSTHDKLLEKLRKAKKVADNEMTESEAILVELNKHRNNLLYEIAQDKRQKERQKQIDNELRRLVAAGYTRSGDNYSEYSTGKPEVTSCHFSIKKERILHEWI